MKCPRILGLSSGKWGCYTHLSQRVTEKPHRLNSDKVASAVAGMSSACSKCGMLLDSPRVDILEGELDHSQGSGAEGTGTAGSRAGALWAG